MKSVTLMLSGVGMVLLLAACDGSDDGGGTPPPPAVGFVDAVVNEITNNTSDSTEPRSLADFPAPNADDTNDSAEPRPLPAS